jgi:hypothetical protein
MTKDERDDVGRLFDAIDMLHNVIDRAFHDLDCNWGPDEWMRATREKAREIVGQVKEMLDYEGGKSE